MARRSKALEEENLARMLEDFSKLSGIDFADIVSVETAEAAKFDDRFIDEGETEFDVEEPTIEPDADFSAEQDYGDDSGDYLDEYFDDIDVAQDEKDTNGDIA